MLRWERIVQSKWIQRPRVGYGLIRRKKKDIAKPLPALDGIRRDIYHAERRRAVAVSRNATDCVEARTDGLDFSATTCYCVAPLSRVWHGTPVATPRPCRRLLLSANPSAADGLVVYKIVYGIQSVPFPSLRQNKRDFLCDVDGLSVYLLIVPFIPRRGFQL